MKAGTRAPEFELADIDGQRVSLASLLDAGPVLAAFFKISCPTCQYALPFLQRLNRHNVVAVSQDGAEGTQQFRDKFRISLRTLLDPVERGYPVSTAYKLTNVPTLYLIEPDRTITLAGMGFSRADLESAGQRFGAVVFRPGEKTPEFKPG